MSFLKTLILLGIFGGVSHVIADGGTAGASEEISPEFESEIQPLLAKHCLKCHGNGDARGGFRLTDRTSALKSLESGKQGIVPGKPDESELVARVISTEEGMQMPPEGERVSPEGIERLRSWIAAGAKWPAHWAYRPLVSPPLPGVEGPQDEKWGLNPIDRFVLQKLNEKKLGHAPPAEKRTLLRRVCFDLTGMPPTPGELQDFLEDDSEDAYEKVVDRLLGDVRYGERWARRWMDLVHYAETHGHDQDRVREHVWPYRDYLIKSFNDDKPFGRFAEEQIAGDILFPGEAEALVGTGFLAAGPWDESSLRDIQEDSIDRVVGQYLDRDDIVTTVMSTFASSTVHCARCHDHKFDPVSQRDYYGLQAIFATTDKANRAYDSDPAVAMKRRELKRLIADLPGRVKQVDLTLLSRELEQEVSEWEGRAKLLIEALKPLEFTEVKTSQGTTLKTLDDGSLLATGTGTKTGQFPETDIYALTFQTKQEDIAAVQLDLLTHESLPQHGPGCQPQNGNLHLNEVRLYVVEGDESKPVKIARATADFNQEGGWSVEKSIDGVTETAWGIHPESGKPHKALFFLAEPLVQGVGKTLRIELEQSHGRGHLIGRFRLTTISRRAEEAIQAEMLPTAIAGILKKPRTERNNAEQVELTAAFLKPQWERELANLPPEQMVYCGTNRYEADKSYRPAAKVRTIHVLHRGDVNQPRDVAEPGVPGLIPDLSGKPEITETGDDGGRRVALAKWISDPKNVVTWRSIANRVWQSHFGRGIVDTPNDFGKMGGTPTHPELLDWLSLELQGSGGSLKQLHRLILTSATYRQAVDYDSRNAEIDGENRFLWRMNRSRLDAESIRDAILQISGTLNPQMGGPSVRQFHLSPGAQVTPVLDYLNFNPDDPANYRRSVYRFVFRTVPDPFMDAMDCPDASQLTPTRNSSFTPLQALASLHDRLMIRQSEKFADLLKEKHANEQDQIRELYRRVLLREPRENELSAMSGYVGLHGLANGCRMLWNSNEFMFVD